MIMNVGTAGHIDHCEAIRPIEYYRCQGSKYIHWQSNIINPKPIAAAICAALGVSLYPIDCGFPIGTG